MALLNVFRTKITSILKSGWKGLGSIELQQGKKFFIEVGVLRTTMAQEGHSPVLIFTVQF